MSALYIVLPLALLVVGAAIAAYAWAVRRGQFDDLSTPPLRMLHDEEESTTRRSEADEDAASPKNSTE